MEVGEYKTWDTSGTTHLNADLLLESAENACRDLLNVAGGGENDDGEAARLPSLPGNRKALLEHR